MAPAVVGLSALLCPSPDLVASGRSPCLDGFDADFKLGPALAAARLAMAAATDVLTSSVRASADAWAIPAPAGPGAGGGACPLGFTSTRKLKNYPDVDVPPTWSLLAPQQLLWLFLKNTGIVLLLQTNFWLYQALEAEEQALQQGTQAQLPPYPDVLQQLVRAAWASWRELLTRLTRSEIKHAIRAIASRRAAWKVLKDPRESVTNKALFYFNTPSLQLLPLYTTTMFRTQLPTYAAEFLVACAYDAVAELQLLVKLPALAAAPPAAQQPPPAQQPSAAAAALASLQRAQARAAGALQQLLRGQARVDWALLPASSRRLGLKVSKNLVRVAGTAVCAAAGAGVAGAVAPRESAGTWAFRGLIVTDLLFANLFMLLLDGPLAGAFGEQPPPGGGGGGAKSPAPHLPTHPGNDMVRLFNDLTS